MAAQRPHGAYSRLVFRWRESAYPAHQRIRQVFYDGVLLITF